MPARTAIPSRRRHRPGRSRRRAARLAESLTTGALTLAGFILVNAFWQYLTTGTWFEFSLGAYLRPLSDVFFHPLDIFTHPWMIVVIALLLAAVIVIPIVVANLGRLTTAGLLLLVVAVVGHAPVLALVMAVGCVMAAQTGLRNDMPFAGMLLAVVPVAIHMIVTFLTFPSGADPTPVLPIQRWVLPAPLLLALIAAALAFALAALLARNRHLRALAAFLLMAAMAAGALGVFRAKIGPDELAYALIADEVSADDKMFPDVSLHDWKRRNAGEGLNPQTTLIRVGEDLRFRQFDLSERCHEFHRKYPHSKRAAAVLWIEGQCMDLQLKRQALLDGLVRYSASYTSPASGDVWRRLTDAHAGTRQAAAARWHLAVLALRAQRVRRADELLRGAAEHLQAYLETHPTGHRAGQTHQIFFPPSTVPSYEYCADVLFKVRRLVWLIEQNRLLEDARSAKAFAEYLAINRPALTRDEYLAQLNRLMEAHEDTRFEDNLRLEIAQAVPTLWGNKIDMLVQLARETTDAAVEANFQLGELTMQEPVLLLKKDVKKPREYFEIVIAAPVNPWVDLARQRLALLKDEGAEKP